MSAGNPVSGCIVCGSTEALGVFDEDRLNMTVCEKCHGNGEFKKFLAFEIEASLMDSPELETESRRNVARKGNGQLSARQKRAYQEEGLANIKAAWQRGVRRQLAVMPTGSGKTFLASQTSQMFSGRTLFLAHRRELIEQAVEEFQRAMPNRYVGIVQASENRIWADVAVASVQTLAQDRRLAQVYKNFELIVVDECHHVMAKSWRKVLVAMGCFDERGPLTLGLTATPERGDGKGLGGIFQEVVFKITLPELIRQGYLVPATARKIQIDANFNGVKLDSHGDLSAKHLVPILEAANAPELIAHAIAEQAADRRTLVFTPSVSMALKTAEALRAIGFKAESASERTDRDVRKAMVGRLGSGETQVLCNCLLWTEGFDVPSIDCVVMARPTRSKSLAVQTLGRGLRLSPETGKTDCLLLDLTGVSEMDLVTADIILEPEPEMEEEQEPVEVEEEVEFVGGEEEGDFAEETGGNEDFGRPVFDPNFFVTEIELFKREGFSEVNGRFIKNIGTTNLVAYERGNHWSVMAAGAGTSEEIVEDMSIEQALSAARNYAGARTIKHLVDPNAEWRSKGVKETQIDALCHVQGLGPETRQAIMDRTITRGEASDILNRWKARKAAAGKKRR